MPSYCNSNCNCGRGDWLGVWSLRETRKFWLPSVTVTFPSSFWLKCVYRHTDLSKLYTYAPLEFFPLNKYILLVPRMPCVMQVLVCSLQWGSMQLHLLPGACSGLCHMRWMLEFMLNETNWLKHWGLGSAKWKSWNEQKPVRCVWIQNKKWTLN